MAHYQQNDGQGYGGGVGADGNARTVYTNMSTNAPAANAIDRMFIDPGSAMVRELTDIRPFYCDNEHLNPNLIQAMGPSKEYQRLLPLPTSLAAHPYPEASCATRYCRTCIHKPRCPINVVRWTPDGRRLISGASSGDLTIWSGLGFMMESIISLNNNNSAIRALEWSTNGDWIVSGENNGTIKLYNGQFRLQMEKTEAHSASLRGLSFSPTDAKFASCSDDLGVKIWNFADFREERKLSGHGFDVKSVDWHPHKSLVLSGGRDNLVKLWDPRSSTKGGEILTISGHKKSVNVVSWNPINGNWFLSASRDRSVRIYDVRMLQAANRLHHSHSTDGGDRALHVLSAHSSEVYSAAWHPYHEDLLATGGYEGALLFWVVGSRSDDGDATTPVNLENHFPSKTSKDALTKEKAQDPRVQASIPAAHENAIWTMDWHPLGHMLCTGSNDHTCKFWSRMRPGATVDHYFQGFNRDITEVHVLSALGIAPHAPNLEEELIKKRKLQNGEAKEEKDESIVELTTKKIPGIGLIDEEQAENQVGLLLNPLTSKVSYNPELNDEVVLGFTTEVIGSIEQTRIGASQMQLDPNKAAQAVSNSAINANNPGGQGIKKRPFDSMGGMHNQNQAKPNGAPQDQGVKRPKVDLKSLTGERVTGFVKHWNEKGFGFIKPNVAGLDDCYVRAIDVLEGYGKDGTNKIYKGDRVVFRYEHGENKINGTKQVKAKEVVHIDFYPDLAKEPANNNNAPNSNGPPGMHGGMHPPHHNIPPAHNMPMQHRPPPNIPPNVPPHGMHPPQNMRPPANGMPNMPPPRGPPPSNGMHPGPNGMHHNQGLHLRPIPSNNMRPGPNGMHQNQGARGMPPVHQNQGQPNGHVMQLLQQLLANNASQDEIARVVQENGITPEQLQPLLGRMQQQNNWR